MLGQPKLPPWIDFDAASARFSVDSSKAPAGSYFLTVTGADGSGVNSSVTVKLDVQARAVVPVAGSHQLKQLAQYGAPVLLSVALLLLAAAAFAWRHRRIKRTSARVKVWAATVLSRSNAGSPGRQPLDGHSVDFSIVQRLHAEFLKCACREVECASLEEALQPLEWAALQFYGGSCPSGYAFTTLPVKTVCRVLLNMIRVDVFEDVGSGGVAGTQAALSNARALHRYLRLVLAVHAGRGCRLSPQLKQAVTRYMQLSETS
jgi:hypothetical protein